MVRPEGGGVGVGQVAHSPYGREQVWWLIVQRVGGGGVRWLMAWGRGPAWSALPRHFNGRLSCCINYQLSEKLTSLIVFFSVSISVAYISCA